MQALSAIADRVFDPHQRRSVRLLYPAAQLKLPLYFLVLTVGFGSLLAWNSYAAYARLYQATLSTVPHGFGGIIGEQTARYLIVSSSILAGFALSTLALGLAYVHRLLGPSVALRRQILSLKAGDYSARIQLRGGEAVFADLARDLNALAERLERAEQEALARARYRESRAEAAAPAPRD